MKNQEQYTQDYKDLEKVGGSENFMLRIEKEGYFNREKQENLREKGYDAEMIEGSENAFWDVDLEYILRRGPRLLSALEQRRCDEDKSQQWGKDEEDAIYDWKAKEWISEEAMKIRTKEREIIRLNKVFFEDNGFYDKSYIKKCLRNINSKYYIV